VAEQVAEPAGRHAAEPEGAGTEETGTEGAGAVREFAFSEEHEELRRTVRRFCAEHAGEGEARRLMESPLGHDRTVWSRLGSELGVLGLPVPAEHGGTGGDLVASAVAFEEMGAGLLCGPLLGTVALAAPALTALAAGRPDDLLSRLAEGADVAAFAVPDRGGRYDPEAVEVTAEETPAGWRLNGVVTHVVDGLAADVLLVAGRHAEGVSLFRVDGAADGLGREAMSTMDLTRRQAEIVLRDCPARLLAAPPETAAACAHAFRVGAVLLAAEQAGGARHLLELSVRYARDRIQFGRPVGSFQAVKHRLADMLVAVEHARSTAHHAAWALQYGTDDPDLAAALAKAYCSEAYQRVAADAMQVHGGIAFTWEHQIHLYFKRAVTNAALLGGPAAQRDRIAELVLDGRTAS